MFKFNNLYLKNTNISKNNIIRQNILHHTQPQPQPHINLENISKKDVIININKTIEILNNLTHIEKINYLKNLKVLCKIGKINNYSNSVLLLENFIVKKNLKFNQLGSILFKNEVKALMRLNKYDCFPKLIYYDSKTLSIYMSFCGCEINNKNIPNDYIIQYEKIKNIFLNENLTNNDILDRNICVLEDQINIIDFGLCSDIDLQKILKDFYFKLKKLYDEKSYLLKKIEVNPYKFILHNKQEIIENERKEEDEKKGDNGENQEKKNDEKKGDDGEDRKDIKLVECEEKGNDRELVEYEEEKGVECEEDSDEELIQENCDEDIINSVILNLENNVSALDKIFINNNDINNKLKDRLIKSNNLILKIINRLNGS